MSDRPTDGTPTPDDQHWFYGNQPPTTPPPTATAPTGADDPKPGRSKTPWIAAAVAVVIILAAGVFALTSKDSGSGGSAVAAGQAGGNGAANAGGYGNGNGFRRAGGGTRGTITSIDGSTISLQVTQRDPGQGTQDGQSGNQSSGTTSTVKVETTDDTRFTEQVEGSVSDLAKGDTVLVMSADSSSSGTSSKVTASQIVDQDDAASATTGSFPGAGGTPPSGADGYGPPMGEGGAAGPGAPSGNDSGTAPTPPDGSSGTGSGSGGQGFPGGGRMGGMTAGTITSIDGSTITVKTQSGSVTVTTTSDTTVVTTKEIALSDLAKGDEITVSGSTSDDTVTATAVRKVDADLQGGFGGGPQGGPGGYGPGGPNGSAGPTPTTTS